MTLAIDLLLTLVGLVVLVKAADVFVDGAAGMSFRLRIPPVVVGAVVIGLGTSMPEVLVSALAASGGDADLGVGNIVGSNIANLSLVLGVAALLSPVSRAQRARCAGRCPLSVGGGGGFGLVVFAGLPLAGGVAAAVRARGGPRAGGAHPRPTLSDDGAGRPRSRSWRRADAVRRDDSASSSPWAWSAPRSARSWWCPARPASLRRAG